MKTSKLVQFGTALLLSSALVAPASFAQDTHPVTGNNQEDQWRLGDDHGEHDHGHGSDLAAMAMMAAAAEKAGGTKGKGLHLEGERDLAFDTDEGTWMSLDVSPDGSTIMFELLGDIYTMPVEGGEATAIVTGMAFQSQPVFSPDGTKIAYISDEAGAENIYIADANGENAKKLSSQMDGGMLSPAWSADGSRVFVSQFPLGLGALEIWSYHTLGGKGVAVTKSSPTPNTPRNRQGNYMGVVASDDGRYLYYAHKSGGFSYNMPNFPWRVVRRDLMEGTQDTIATAQGGAFKPMISPDGTKLVYATRYKTQTGLRLRDLATGDDNWLAYPVTKDDMESRSTRDLMPTGAFAPDGQSIIITSGGKFERIALADGARTVIPFTAKVDQKLGPNLVNQTPLDDGTKVTARITRTPALSPSGNSVVFSALGELYTMNMADGAEPTKIDRAGDQAFMPSWSADGRWITYVTWSPEGGHVWKMRTDGKAMPERVSQNSGYYSDPVFTPNGREIVAIRAPQHQFINTGGAGAQRDLVALNAESGDVRVVLPSTQP